MCAEHWEARRKQQFIDKKHKYQMDRQEKLQLLQEQNAKELQEQREQRGSSYEKQLKKQKAQDDRCPRGEYHHNRDAERRQEFYKNTKGDYTAKIRLRYNDTNFIQQW